MPIDISFNRRLYGSDIGAALAGFADDEQVDFLVAWSDCIKNWPMQCRYIAECSEWSRMDDGSKLSKQKVVSMLETLIEHLKEDT